MEPDFIKEGIRKGQEYHIIQILNKVLEIMGSDIVIEKYEDLPKFRRIARYEIINENVYNYLKETENNYFKYFNKFACGYFRQKQLGEKYSLSVIRGMIKQMGGELKCHWDRHRKVTEYTIAFKSEK